MVAFDQSVAQELLAEPGKWDEISVVADDGVSQQALTERLSAVLPAGVQAVPGSTVIQENQQFSRDAMSFFTYFMDFFAVVALLVGAFMIFNTFSITVAQRTRQNGLLRALGATRRQVLASVLIEALVVGRAGLRARPPRGLRHRHRPQGAARRAGLRHPGRRAGVRARAPSSSRWPPASW